MGPRRPTKTEQVVALLTAALTLAAAWQMMPPHERKLLTMKALAVLQRLTAVVAAAQGREGMASELGGRHLEAARFYRAAYRVACWRDQLAAALEAMGP
jgi:hypothetical protein